MPRDRHTQLLAYLPSLPRRTVTDAAGNVNFVAAFAFTVELLALHHDQGNSVANWEIAGSYSSSKILRLSSLQCSYSTCAPMSLHSLLIPIGLERIGY